MTEKDLRNKYFLAYQYKCVSDFEEGWPAYEKKLRKYIMTNTKFNDWIQIKIADENDPKLAMRS